MAQKTQLIKFKDVINIKMVYFMKKKRMGRPKADLSNASILSIRLDKAIEDKGLTRSSLEDQLNLGRSAISKMIKSGNSMLDRVWKIEDALSLPRGYLCGADLPENESSPSAEASAPRGPENPTIKELLTMKAELLEQVKHIDEKIAKKAGSL